MERMQPMYPVAAANAGSKIPNNKKNLAEK